MNFNSIKVFVLIGFLVLMAVQTARAGDDLSCNKPGEARYSVIERHGFNGSLTRVCKVEECVGEEKAIWQTSALFPNWDETPCTKVAAIERLQSGLSD